METKIETFSRSVESYQTDFTGRLSLSLLSHIMLSCAGRHANRRGFGMDQLHAYHYTWVLSRFAIEMQTLPTTGEDYAVSTWIESVHHLQTVRCFTVAGAAGGAIGHARSAWAMIDLATRRPADLEAFADGQIGRYALPDGPCPIEPPVRLRAVNAAEPAHTIVARYEDIDINGHVNAIRYIDHALDLLPLDAYRTDRPRRIDVAYLSESHHGDELSLYQETASGSRLVEIRKNGHEPVCRLKLTI